MRFWEEIEKLDEKNSDFLPKSKQTISSPAPE
jgi:hypothetical protein